MHFLSISYLVTISGQNKHVMFRMLHLYQKKWVCQIKMINNHIINCIKIIIKSYITLKESNLLKIQIDCRLIGMYRYKEWSF